MTQVGPPDWATTTLRAAMVRSVLSLAGARVDGLVRALSSGYAPGDFDCITGPGTRQEQSRRIDSWLDSS